jgi:hypothetical protein
MRRNDNPMVLRQIARIRDLQRAAAEARAARAASDLRGMDEARRNCERERSAAEARWLGSVSGPSLRLEMLASLSAALLREEGMLRQAQRDVDAASAELDRGVSHWHVARMRSDAAKSLALEAAKRQRNRREEAQLQEAADRHVQRWSGR